MKKKSALIVLAVFLLLTQGVSGPTKETNKLKYLPITIAAVLPDMEEPLAGNSVLMPEEEIEPLKDGEGTRTKPDGTYKVNRGVSVLPYGDIRQGGNKDKAMNLVIELNGQMVSAEYSPEDASKAIDDYYHERDCPLSGYGKTFIEQAMEHETDWRLAPAIAMRESTGAKECFRSHNPFGWGRASFDSFEEAIEKIIWNLAGENPETAGHYKDKTVWKKLRIYNSVIEAYPNEVMDIMKAIEGYIK